MKAKKKTISPKANQPIQVTVDASLNHKLDDQPYCEAKVAKANYILKKFGIPK